MKPVRAVESMANIQSDVVPVGDHRTWVLASVMPPLHYTVNPWLMPFYIILEEEEGSVGLSICCMNFITYLGNS
jgi:hypothetical protein